MPMPIIRQAQIACTRTRISAVEPWAGGVRIVTELGTHTYPGAFVLPGLVDAHAHIVGHGMRLSVTSLYECTSHASVCDTLKSQTYRRGEWVYAMGWNEESWSCGTAPSAQLLDGLFPDTPVYLRRADGHAAWVNSVALRRAGIDETTPDPEGGAILRMASGAATGILVDNAMLLVEACIPAPGDDDIIDAIRRSQAACSSKGLTEIHDMDVAPRHIPIFREMAERGELRTRVQTWVSGQNDEWMAAGVLPALGEFQTTLGVKFFADGALGSRGAALLEPYEDAPDSRGLFLLDQAEFYRKARRACEQGFHVATHAIGDAANRMVIDTYERLRKEGIAGAGTILRIEHTQIIQRDDVPRMAANDLWASVQPVHCTSDARMAEKRLGSRSDRGYPWRSLIDDGVRICAGSDFPIESHDPLTGIDAFCRRVPSGSPTAWFGEERIDREEAILAYTAWAHASADVAYRRGEIRPDFDADLTVIDRDILSCPEEELSEVKVLASYCGGRRMFVAEGATDE
ncbi:MAG: amidohydrolase [Candidatus Kapaibacterium sp.]